MAMCQADNSKRVSAQAEEYLESVCRIKERGELVVI